MTERSPRDQLLVVDDAPDTLELLRRNLTEAGYGVRTAPNVARALELLADAPADLVITDLRMPGASGMELVRHVRENLPDSEVMMITGYATVSGAVEAVKRGAEEYLAKPFTDEELLSAVRRTLDKLHLRRAGRPHPEEQEAGAHGLIGESRAMTAVREAIRKAAGTSATVLVTGESGTGKELVARAIHYSGDRAGAPFVPVNCGGIPESLLESELFGHVKGAFTGATGNRDGFFQTADRGTLFLDEISEMSVYTQVKLLRALQDREVRMVGSARARTVDVRIIAATNKDLYGLVGKGLFRQDLFFRLNVLNITMPPLRDRDDDVLQLARHFLGRFSKELGRDAPEFAPAVLRCLTAYSWPGNVRELENLIQRLLVMTERDRVDVSDLPEHMRYTVRCDGGLDRTLAEVQAEHIQRVLQSVGGNKTQAARLLGIDRKTLREKLKQLDRSDDRSSPRS